MLFYAVIVLACVALALGQVDNEESCIASIATTAADGFSFLDHMTLAMRRGFWQCAKETVQQSNGLGSALDLRGLFETEQRNIIREISSLKSVIESSLPMANVNPAFQWAQSPQEILLNVKFSHKIDAPATLNVEANNVTILPNRLILMASDGRKNFKLDLELLKSIVPEESRYDMASVGRMTFTLKKEGAPSKWSRLLRSRTKKPSHMHVWWEMQERHNRDLESIEEADDDSESDEGSERQKKNSKKSKNKTKAAAAAATATAETSSNDANKNETSTEKTPLDAEYAAREKKIDESISNQIKEVEDAGKAKKNEVDQRAREEKKRIDAEILAQRQQLEHQASVEKEKLKLELKQKKEEFDEL